MGKLKDLAIQAAHGLYNAVARPLPRSIELPPDPFAALNEFFEATWVLSIRRNERRHASVREEFSRLNFEFFWGVDGWTLTPHDPRYDREKAKRIFGRELHVNELACALSHLSIHQAVLDRGLESVLVLEDDATLIRRSSRWVSSCLMSLPADWELFYLGYRDGELRGFVREVQEFFGKPRDESEVVSRHVGRGIRTAALHEFTHAYAVTRTGARKLLEGAYPVFLPADGWLEERVRSRTLTAYSSVPKLFAQKASLASSIHAPQRPS